MVAVILTPLSIINHHLVYPFLQKIHWWSIHKPLQQPRERVRSKYQPKTTISDLTFKLATGGVIRFYTGERLDNLRGMRFHYVIIDEASYIPDLDNGWNNAIRPTLTDYKGKALFLSTPRGKNYFYSLYLKGLEANGEWESFKYSTYDNPYIANSEIDSIKQSAIPVVFEQEYMANPAENERLRVQLAGCGVAAMQNTESSKAQRVQKESYGWSESYGDVCRAVDREIELRAERDQLQAENERLTQDRDEWRESTVMANANAASEEKRRRDMQEQRDGLAAKLETANQSSAHWQHQFTELKAKLVPLANNGKDAYQKLQQAAAQIVSAQSEPSKWGCVGPDAQDIAWDKFNELANFVCLAMDSPPICASKGGQHEDA